MERAKKKKKSENKQGLNLGDGANSAGTLYTVSGKETKVVNESCETGPAAAPMRVAAAQPAEDNGSAIVFSLVRGARRHGMRIPQRGSERRGR